jgi:hypothetical protein
MEDCRPPWLPRGTLGGRAGLGRVGRSVSVSAMVVFVFFIQSKG